MSGISVLLPVRDAGPWLLPALASLWRQRVADLEVIAVDDGSTDGSGETLERVARREPRLRVLHTPPRGLPAALNTALAHARGTWIARHDADDLSHRDRLASQQAFLAAHPRVAVVGCGVRLFPASETRPGMRRWADWHNGLQSHDEMARDALIDSPLCHGTALLRRRWLERVGGWAERGWAEDVDLWLRLFEAGARFAKLPRVLYGWRQHPRSATRRDPRYGPDRFLALRMAALERGMLARATRVTVVGVGTSLERWRRALEGTGRRVRAIEGPSATPPQVGDEPVVLVYGAAAARRVRRTALLGRGLCEGRDFTFVA